MKLFKCEVCNGKGGWYEDYGLGIYYQTPWQICPNCNGKGWNFWNWIWCHLPIRFVEWIGDRMIED